MSADLRVRLLALSQRLRGGKAEASDVLVELDALALDGVGGKREGDIRSAVEDARRALAAMPEDPERMTVLTIRASDALARAGEHAFPSK